MDIWIVSGTGRLWKMLICVSWCAWAQVAQGEGQLNHCLWPSSSLLDHMLNWCLTWLLQFSFPPVVCEITLIGLTVITIFASLTSVLWYLIVVLLCIFLMSNLCLLDFWISSFENSFLKTLPISLLGFSFLTDLDWGLLKNSGTLSGQVLRSILIYPMGRSYSFHMSEVTSCASFLNVSLGRMDFPLCFYYCFLS